MLESASIPLAQGLAAPVAGTLPIVSRTSMPDDLEVPTELYANYAPAWKRWTLAEPVDKKMGAVSEKA